MSDDKVSIKTPEFVSLQFQTAGLGSRAIAFMIDQAILIIINMIILVILFFVMTGPESLGYSIQTPTIPIAIAIILIFIINAGYFFLLEYMTGGRTIGKKLLGIRVIQDNGHSITLLSSFIRNLLRLIDSLPASYLTGILMIFFHSQHKRLGDVVAGTIVVHERKGKKRLTESSLDKELKERNITGEMLILEEWTLKSFGSKEWNLIKAYSERFTHIEEEERRELTKKLAGILLVKVGIEVEGKNTYDLENLLLSLYLVMREEWEYEL
ncbi:RDD family protein [Evansella tamaricis]|uniref:RDD family protein n=1 Tax=Evansella tamaricis TaxID=2069301 RepID=A0ABS6JAP2_9BACI|nr:RDD family protein [Evansella tamaricis]MBU9710505.1 RDD family protein [Evansella tamaricis]